MPEDHHCVSIALPADGYCENKAMLIAQPTRTKRARVIGEVSLTGLSSLPGYELVDGEVEEILWEIAQAAAVIVAKRLPQLQALNERRDQAQADKAKRGGTEH